MILVFTCNKCGAESELDLTLEDFVDYLTEGEALDMEANCETCESFIGLRIKFTTYK